MSEDDTSGKDETIVRLDPNPEGKEAEDFESPDQKKRRLQNRSLEQRISIQREYVDSARSLAETWIGFTIVVTIIQIIKPYGMHLEPSEFIAIAATALGSVIALWAIVGRGVFGAGTGD